MRKFLPFCTALLLWISVQPALSQSHPKADDWVELQITPSFSPEDLSNLIQKLGKRGILLRFEETGYCNGELRVVKGEIIGSDGSRYGFETQSLKRLHIEIVVRAKTLGINTVKVKKHWRKCRPKASEEVEEQQNESETEAPPLQQI